jgi:hypothetical protein
LLCTLRLMVRVPVNKRQELIQALSSFVADEQVRPFRRLVMQDLNDESLICWVADWHSRECLNRFLESPTYRVLKGAAQVLGALEEVRLAEYEYESATREPS